MNVYKKNTSNYTNNIKKQQYMGIKEMNAEKRIRIIKTLERMDSHQEFCRKIGMQDVSHSCQKVQEKKKGDLNNEHRKN